MRTSQMQTVNPKQKIRFYGISTQSTPITWGSLFISKQLFHPMIFFAFSPTNRHPNTLFSSQASKRPCSLIKPLQIFCCPRGQQKKATSHSFLGLRSLQVQLWVICNWYQILRGSKSQYWALQKELQDFCSPFYLSLTFSCSTLFS